MPNASETHPIVAQPGMTRTYFTSGVNGPAKGFPTGSLKLSEGFDLTFLVKVEGDEVGFASPVAASSASFSPRSL